MVDVRPTISRVCDELAEMFRTTVSSISVNDPVEVHEICSSRLLIGRDPMDEPYFVCRLATGMVITLGPFRVFGLLGYRIYPKYSEYDIVPTVYKLPGGAREMEWLERHASGAEPLHRLKVLADEFITSSLLDPRYRTLTSASQTEGMEDVDDAERSFNRNGRRFDIITMTYQW